jgi:hypothetical protein
VTKVRGFLGLAGYYRRFINQFATLATPLTDLTKETPEFRWTPQAESTFEQIKDAMVRARVLVIPNTSPNAGYIMYTDTSGFAVGVVLLQDQGIRLQPVAYHARKMNKHEVHYHVHEQELLAVRDALLKFRCFLWHGGIYGNYGPRHVATLLSAARFVYSIGAMASSFSAL